MKRIACALLTCAALASCATTTPAELRAKAPDVYNSRATVDDVLACMRTNPSDMLQTVTYPGSGKVDFSMGGESHMYYLATVSPTERGSTVEIRTSGRSLLAYTEADFRKALSRCAPAV